MRDILLGFLILIGVVMVVTIDYRLSQLNQTIKEKQIVLNIQEFQWDVEAQNGSVINLPGEGK